MKKGFLEKSNPNYCYSPRDQPQTWGQCVWGTGCTPLLVQGPGQGSLPVSIP